VRKSSLSNFREKLIHLYWKFNTVLFFNTAFNRTLTNQFRLFVKMRAQNQHL